MGLSGCLFDGGSSELATGPVHPGAICSATNSTAACPACSTADGALCRSEWYSTALLCTSDAQCGGTAGACNLGYCALKDNDGDGIDDDLEAEVAELNFPKLYLAQDESCGAPHGVIYHVRRHPQDTQRLAITYVVLYDADCGDLTGHSGDAETFAITVDLHAQPGANATVGVQTWAHAGTACGSTSSCQAAPGTGACGESAAANVPASVVVWSSSSKHAEYLSRSTCSDNCLDSCSPGELITGPLLNVGEPDHPLVTDLTDQGFVTLAGGWNPVLLHINPWGSAQFSGGGYLDTVLVERIAPPGP